jgi:alpha-L-arabinofuranosidase
MTKAAVIRTESSIDGYYVNDSKELIHIFMGEWNSWVHQSEPLDTNVAYKQPACVRMGDYIDLYYWRENG